MTVCPLSPPGHDLDCEYCSEESRRDIRDATDLKTKRKVMIKKIIPLGLFCNNHVIGKSGWIRDIQVCAKTLQPTKELKMPVPRKPPVSIPKQIRIVRNQKAKKFGQQTIIEI